MVPSSLELWDSWIRNSVSFHGLEIFQALILQISFLPICLFSFWDPITWISVHQMLSHKTLKLAFFFILHSFSCSNWMSSMTLALISFILSSALPVSCWIPLVYFSVHLLVLQLCDFYVVLHYIFSLLNPQLFMNSPELIEHLYNCYFELLIGKSFISLSLRPFYEVLFFFHLEHIPIFFIFMTLCWFLCISCHPSQSWRSDLV